MSKRSTQAALFPMLAILSGLLVSSALFAKETRSAGDVMSGLLVDYKKDGIVVQVDGEPEERLVLYGTVTQKQLGERHIFPVDRVNIKYKADGETRSIVSIERVVGAQQGVAIGEVLKVYNNFWVAVKPKNGP